MQLSMLNNKNGKFIKITFKSEDEYQDTVVLFKNIMEKLGKSSDETSHFQRMVYCLDKYKRVEEGIVSAAIFPDYFQDIFYCFFDTASFSMELNKLKKESDEKLMKYQEDLIVAKDKRVETQEELIKAKEEIIELKSKLNNIISLNQQNNTDSKMELKDKNKKGLFGKNSAKK